MATRPVFKPASDSSSMVEEVEVEFEWHPGFSKKQKRKSIRSLHRSARRRGLDGILEISTKSESELGRNLSAFNLMVRKNPPLSVESAYQGSKVFQNGGPYHDLYGKSPLEAKKDDRLRNSGDLVAFDLNGQQWPLEPKTAFYDWLYLRALNQYKGRIDQLLKYDGFTDIEFNPDKSVNCQARAIAMGVALRRAGYLEEAIRSKDSFIRTLKHGIPESVGATARSKSDPDLFTSNSHESPEEEDQYLADSVLNSVRETVAETEDHHSAKKKAAQLLLVKIFRQLRSEAGLTQKEVGEKIGVSRSTVSDFENAKNEPQLGMIMDYFDAVDADLELTISAENVSIPISFMDLVESDSQR